MLKKLIIPIIIVALFAVSYFIVYPYAQRRIAKDNVFSDFETSLKNLNLEYTKSKLDAKEYGAWKAYMYTVGDKNAKLYVFDKDSAEYNSLLSNYYIVSSKNPDDRLYGMFVNHCLLYMDVDFPNDQDILIDFINSSRKYSEE